MQTWTLPLLGLFFLKKYITQKVVRWLPLIILSSWWMLVIGSGARGTFIASIIALLITWMIFRKSAWPFMKWQFVSLFSGGILYGILFKGIPLLIGKNTSMAVETGGPGVSLSRMGATGRLSMWENAWDLFLQNPFLGIGPMQFADITYGNTFSAPHNIYLQILTEWGSIAFIIIGAVALWAFWNWLKQCLNKKQAPHSTKKNTRIALTVALISVSIHGFVSGIINTPLSQVLMCVVVGWAAGLYLETRYGKNYIIAKSPGLSVKIISRTAIIVLILSFSGILIDDMHGLEDRKDEYVEKVNSTKLYPRYWGQGKIGIENN